ncbi:MAG: fibronectin type III domain-containing protein [Firmicutes bacterium]|nr:fibronectin type III domain-containing protein [Bacillota bacterium]
MYKHYPVLILLLLLMCISLTGCFKGESSTSLNETGSVKVLVSSPELSQGGTIQGLCDIQTYPGEIAFMQAEVRLTNGSIILSETALLEDGKAEIMFPGVVIGPWDVIVELKDFDGNPAYTGSSRVSVIKDQVVHANIMLQPALGMLKIRIDLAKIPNHEKVARVRLYKDSSNLRSQKSITRNPGVNILIAEIPDLSPKTYDMMIMLFDEDGELVYESLWEEVHILPGKTTTIDWDFSLGDVSLEVGLSRSPKAPTNLIADLSEAGVILSWNGSEYCDPVEYIIYKREMPFGPLKIAATIQHSPGTRQTFTDTEVKTGVIYLYVVTAANAFNNESSRSNEITISIP